MDPDRARSWEEYVRLLGALYRARGRPSFRTVELTSKRAGYKVSASTANKLAKASGGRPSRRSVEGFLYGCGVEPTAHVAWLEAWDRLNGVAARLTDPPSDNVIQDRAVSIGAAIERALIIGTEILCGRDTHADGLVGAITGYRRIAARLTEGQVQRLLAYISSPDFKQLAPQVAALWSPLPRLEGVAAALRRQLLHGVRLWVGAEDRDLQRLTDALADTLQDPGILQIVDDPDVGAAIEGFGSATATANAEVLAGTVDLATLLDTAALLRARVAALHADIRLPHTGQNRSVPWEKLYVPPGLTAASEMRTFHVSYTLAPRMRTVVLGDPGAGKSTLAAKLAYDVATATQDDLSCLAPFLVVLRDLSRALDNGQHLLDEYLVSVCQGLYHVRITADTMRYLLFNGRAVVILDGLDELTDIRLRGVLVRHIEGFAVSYPLVPIIVTSRRIGYEYAPLSKPMFTACSIESFDTDRVRSYVQRWFSLDEGTAPSEREELAGAFLDESRSIEDLRRNPLLLSLLCAMYAAEHFIPRNRAQVYERCALMVFEQWDRMRKGLPNLMPFSGQVRAAVQQLAWHLLTERGGSGMPRSGILRLLMDQLTAKRYVEDEAADMAEEFLRFCAGRAWVLTEVGATSAEPIYGFAHRTFMEFFAAEHLVRHNPVPKQGWAVLADHVGEASWEIVGQLTIQLFDRNLDEGADKLLNAVLDAVDGTNEPPSTAAIEFAARALQHVAPSPPVVARIVDKVVDRALALPLSARIMPWFRYGRAQQKAVDMADSALFTVLERPLDTNVRALTRAFVARLTAEVVAGNQAALLLTDQFGWPYSLLLGAIGDEVVRATGESFDRWHTQTPWYQMWHSGENLSPLPGICFRFGPAPLFMIEVGYRLHTQPLWDDLLAHGEISIIGKVREVLLRSPVPWLPWRIVTDENTGGLDPVTVKAEDVAVVDTCILLALPFLESDLPSPIDGGTGLAQVLRILSRTRRESRGADDVQSSLTKIRVSSATQEFVLRWAIGEFNVIQEEPRPQSPGA